MKIFYDLNDQFVEKKNLKTSNFKENTKYLTYFYLYPWSRSDVTLWGPFND